MNIYMNEEIIRILKENGISVDDGLTYLLSLHYGLKPTFIPDILKTQILISGIIIPKDTGIEWKIPLFSDMITHFEWVKEYRDAFKKINPERSGNLKTCVARFRKFFADNPEVRVEDVKDAVNLYFRSLKNPQYLMKSHNFIFMGQGTSKTSELEVWLERVYEIRSSEEDRTSLSNTMK